MINNNVILVGVDNSYFNSNTVIKNGDESLSEFNNSFGAFVLPAVSGSYTFSDYGIRGTTYDFGPGFFNGGAIVTNYFVDLQNDTFLLPKAGVQNLTVKEFADRLTGSIDYK